MLNEKNLRLVSFAPADLRLSPDTQFTFCCVACKNVVVVPLGRVIFSPNTPDESFQREELQALEQKYGGFFRSIGCGFCRGVYLVREVIWETSNGAFRVKVTSVWQISDPAI